jgi:hypothetical protein
LLLRAPGLVENFSGNPVSYEAPFWVGPRQCTQSPAQTSPQTTARAKRDGTNNPDRMRDETAIRLISNPPDEFVAI